MSATKLSSKQILQYITSRNEFKEVLEQMAAQATDERNVNVNSPEYQKAYNLFAKPGTWKRELKHRTELYMSPQEYTEFDIGVVDWGECDPALCEKAFKDWVASGYNKKNLPIERMFVPAHDLRENFRIEVTTTSDDTQIICWTAIVD